jgi:hypothetical protein
MKPIENKRKEDRKKDGESGARLMGLRAAAQYLGLSYWTMRDLAMAGALPIIRIPCTKARGGRTIRRILLDRQDLDAFIEQNKEYNNDYRSTMDWRPQKCA